jgi:ferredoxin
VAVTARTERAAPELRIDRIACDGYGLCAELLPELIELDDWGYPIVLKAAVPDELLGHARRAVEACPVLALRVRSAAGG